MADYLLLFIGTVLVNNFVLVKFLGLCPFMGVSKKLETAMGMGLATTFVMTLASICAWLIDTWILIPLNLVYLRTLAFILVIAVVVQFTEIKKRDGGEKRQSKKKREEKRNKKIELKRQKIKKKEKKVIETTE